MPSTSGSIPSRTANRGTWSYPALASLPISSNCSTSSTAWSNIGWRVGTITAKCRSIALNILYEIDYWQHTRLAPQRADQVEQVIEYLMSNYHHQITLEDMAKVIHVNPVYFSRIFKIATGQTPIQYLTAIRINKAIDLLRESQESITEIAFKLGYKDPSYFSRVFKKSTGVSPLEYRRQRQK